MNLKKAVRVETTSVFLDLIKNLDKDLKDCQMNAATFILHDYYARLCRTLHELAMEEDEVE